jgi:hypothetical protein
MKRKGGYRSAITRVIVTTPATISTEAGPHVVDAIGDAGSLGVMLAAAAAVADRQMPHGV